MKASLPALIFAAAGMAATVLPLSAAQASTGRINFIGAIVEDICDVNPVSEHEQFSMRCPHQGKMVQQTLSLSQASSERVRSDNNVAVNVQYNPQKTLAVVSMSYN